MLYDAFELQKVGEFDDGEGKILCEPIFDGVDEDTYLRVYWTIYGHKPKGGVEALVDCNDESHATKIYDFFCILLEFYDDYKRFC